MKKTTILMLVAMVGLLASSASAALWTDNFDTGETVNTNATNWSPSSNAGNLNARVQNEQSASAPNCMRLLDNSTTGSVYTRRSCDTLSAGVLAYDVLVSQSASQFRSRPLGSGSVMFEILIHDNKLYYDGTDSGATIDVATWYHIKYTWDASDKYHVYVDGTEVTPTAGVDFATAGDVDTIDFQTGSASSTSWNYVDNVNVVPEPVTMVLLGLGGVGALLKRRRRV